MHCAWLLYILNFPHLPLLPVPEDEKWNPISVFANVLVTYLPIHLAVLFSPRKWKRGRFSWWCDSTNLSRSDFAALDRHWHCHTDSSAGVADISSALIQALKFAIANVLIVFSAMEKSNSTLFLRSESKVIASGCPATSGYITSIVVCPERKRKMTARLYLSLYNWCIRMPRCMAYCKSNF